jgi:hypothetical protein
MYGPARCSSIINDEITYYCSSWIFICPQTGACIVDYIMGKLCLVSEEDVVMLVGCASNQQQDSNRLPMFPGSRC